MKRKPLQLMALSAILSQACAPLQPLEPIRNARPDEFIDVDGTQLHLERWGDEGPPVLLVHGFAASTYSWREVGPRLGENHRVLAVDLPGFGFSERPSEREPYSVPGQLRLLEALIDRHGGDSVHLVGHSYGALLSMILAAERPQRVGRLVVISPTLADGETPWPLRNPLTRPFLYPGVRLLLSSPERFRQLQSRAFHRQDVFTDEVSEAYRDRLLVEGFRHAWRGYLASFSEAADGEAFEPEKVEPPTLVIAGRHDRLTPLAEVERIAERLPNAELRVLENSGHSSPEEQPEEVADAIQRFLSR